MDCFVGSSTGALKAISLRDNSFTNLNAIRELQPKNHEITAMNWRDQEQTEVLTAQLDRKLKIYDMKDNSQKTLFTIEGGSGAVKGLHRNKSSDSLLTCVESGLVRIWNGEGNSLSEWKVGDNIAAANTSSDGNELATGGMKNLVKIWDIEQGKQKWSAKNVGRTMLDLDVLVACTDVKFLANRDTLIEATKMHEMRIYDPRAQRRPVKTIPFMDKSITAVSNCFRDDHILAANATGEIGMFDIRAKGYLVCKYKGQTGSIRCISAHPTEPLAASCGIDRFVRLHDLQTKKLVHKIYCKTQLNRVLLRDDLSILNKRMKEDDEFWEKEIKQEEPDSDVRESTSSDDEGNGDEVWDDLEEEGGEKMEVEVRKEKQRKTKRTRGKQNNDDDGEEVVSAKKKKVPPSRKRRDTDLIEPIDAEEPKKKKKIARGKKRRAPEAV
ncbi:hypothetical protein WR25_13824 [Diploscapter pachys]|uniref:Uncharacterized protein n=1 Tax=Diploscapter pachys TaxID=2018661 RepID=A0A2A2JW45_9BILA|nr:hypothetical protein WR25_13824 [Diploscapter pachys]